MSVSITQPGNISQSLILNEASTVKAVSIQLHANYYYYIITKLYPVNYQLFLFTYNHEGWSQKISL